MIEGLYLSTVSTIKEQLTNALVRLYASVLIYLLKARHYYAQNTAGLTSLAILLKPADLLFKDALQEVSSRRPKPVWRLFFRKFPKKRPRLMSSSVS